MNPRAILVAGCVVLASCSEAGPRAVSISLGPNQPASTVGHTVPIPVPVSPVGNWHRDTGIVDGALPEKVGALCQNLYSDPYKGGWITVCAGGNRDLSTGNPTFDQGAIWVSFSPDPRASGPVDQEPLASQSYEYDAPRSSTWVKIVSVAGDIVNLERQDGSSLSFDLATRTYSQ